MSTYTHIINRFYLEKKRHHYVKSCFITKRQCFVFGDISNEGWKGDEDAINSKVYENQFY